MASESSSAGPLIFVSSCVAISLFSSLKRHERRLERLHQKVLASSAPAQTHSKCDEGDITLHHIQNLSEYFPSENVTNSEKYFHLLKSDDYVMGM